MNEKSVPSNTFVSLENRSWPGVKLIYGFQLVLFWIFLILQMDPVQQAVLHHTLGLPPTTKRKHASCSVCRMRFNSQVSRVLCCRPEQSSCNTNPIKHVVKHPWLTRVCPRLRESALSDPHEEAPATPGHNRVLKLASVLR